MKQQISPAVAIGLIVAVVIVVVIFGLKALGSNGGHGSQMPPEAKADMEKRNQAMRHFSPTNAGGQANYRGSGMGSPGLH